MENDPLVMADIVIQTRGDKHYVVMRPVGPADIKQHQVGPYDSFEAAERAYKEILTFVLDNGARPMPITSDNEQ